MSKYSGIGFCPQCKENTQFREGSSQPWPADEMATVARCKVCGLNAGRVPDTKEFFRGQMVDSESIDARIAAGELDR
jgi:hypothetical protein